MTRQDAIAKAHDRLGEIDVKINNLFREQDSFTDFIRDVSSGMPVKDALDVHGIDECDLEGCA